ncbi:MAG: hypothetical protein J6L69_07955 [Lachnospiraceae bacterium]|nr:hypothetical protein [Lachnospiraceae bacterium]
MMYEGKKYVLAMYDVRGKQEYIFRNNHIKEIVGASAIIRDIFEDSLFDAAVEVRGNEDALPAIYSYRRESESSFNTNLFKERMDGDQYIGEVVYDGGGNFFVLYKNEEVCKLVNKIFTKKVIEKTYSLKVLCTYVEIDDFSDYKGDRDRLYKKHRSIEAHESASVPAQVFPFTKVDYMTSMPLYKNIIITRNDGKKEERAVTRESYAKYKKYELEYKKNKDEFGEVFLDNLVKEKGVDSHLAIIYIDGNGMGAKVQDCIADKKDYESCVNSLREFSDSIQKDYVTDRKNDIEKYLEKKYEHEEDRKKSRFIVFAGDEINFICNAFDAKDIIKVYFDGLKDKGSACAGVAIFHSHAPYYEAYRIAEECCESGKIRMKDMKCEEANFVDFHYCQSGIGIDLESIRETESEGIISKPWYVGEIIDDRCICTQQVEMLVEQLNKMARSNVKGLAEPAKKSISSLKMEWNRIRAHSSDETLLSFEETKRMLKIEDEEKLRNLIYDITIVYDLWFAEKE